MPIGGVGPWIATPTFHFIVDNENNSITTEHKEYLQNGTKMLQAFVQNVWGCRTPYTVSKSVFDCQATKTLSRTSEMPLILSYMMGGAYLNWKGG